jgi:predicted unusual protein kinase regulating ubiquinone biosynthesis (AarF/ABC1/UbiB family)
MAQVLARSPEGTLWRLPSLKEDISRPGFIIYEYSTGKSLDKLPTSQREGIQSKIGVELLRQILVEGIYQADPNIGNFKVVVDTEQVKHVDWLDLDHVGRLEVKDRHLLRDLIVELFGACRPEAVAEYLIRTVQVSNNEIENLEKDKIKDWLVAQDILVRGVEADLEGVFTKFLDFLGENKLLLKEDYVTLLRALGLMKPFLQSIPREDLMRFMVSLYAE